MLVPGNDWIFPEKNTKVVLRSAPQKQVICGSDHVAAKIFRKGLGFSKDVE